MSVYSYKAFDQEGRYVKGKLAADNEFELETKLKQSELDLISCKPLTEFNLFSNLHRVSKQEIVLLCIHLHHLEAAGVPIIDSIGDLRDTSSNPKLKEIMMDLYDSLKNGLMLSQGLAKHSNVFDGVFIGLVQTGEKTGNLSEIFEHLEHHYRWVMNLQKKLKKATYYPLFLLILLSCIIGLMMGYVIPKITVFLLAQNIELPWYTVWLINTSEFVESYWEYLISAPILLTIFFMVLAKKSASFKFFVDTIKLNLPIIGSVIRKIEIARLCHFFALMYKSGIGILDCLEAAGAVVKNSVIQKTLKQIRLEINEGKKLAKAAADSKQFPVLVIRMLKVGEDSGNLDKSLENINVFYDAEVNTSIDTLIGALQPILTLLMGGLLMWITLSIFGPIYGSFGTKQY